VGGHVKGTNTIKFVHKKDIPHNRLKDVTYGQFMCTIQQEKKETNCTCLAVGEDRINYPGDIVTPTANMLAAKFCSTVSFLPQVCDS
jgi:hypothetical protein